MQLHRQSLGRDPDPERRGKQSPAKAKVQGSQLRLPSLMKDAFLRDPRMVRARTFALLSSARKVVLPEVQELSAPEAFMFVMSRSAGEIMQDVITKTEMCLQFVILILV